MDDFYEALYSKAGQMFAILAPVAFIFVVVGLWTSINGSGRSGTGYMKAVARAAVLVMVLSQFITWVGMFEESVQSLVYGTLNANPAAVYERYKTLATDPTQGEAHGFWYTLFNLSEKEVFKGIIAVVLWTAQFFAKVTVYIAYVVYKLAVAYLIAMAPFFIGCLATRSASHTGTAFLFGTVGVLLWPLGWGFASLITDAFLTVMAQADFVGATGMEGMKNLLAVAAAGLWIIFSTIAAPLVIQKVLTTGAGVGTALMSGGLAAVKSATQAGSTAGAALAMTGVGAPVALAGAAGAGAMAFGSSAMSGSSSSGSGYLLGNVMRMGMSGPSTGSGSECEPSGGGSSNPPAPSYNRADPANDQQAAEVLAQSKN